MLVEVTARERTLRTRSSSGYRLSPLMFPAIAISNAAASIRACLLVSNRWKVFSAVFATINSSLRGAAKRGELRGADAGGGRKSGYSPNSIVAAASSISSF